MKSCTNEENERKLKRLAEVIEEARYGISNVTDIPPDVIARWLAYIEDDTELEGPLKGDGNQ